jgi:DHA1 family purine ribonucleoside efflux pump-like MFS transporter
MLGRAFLGMAVGGFWSVSAAIIMRVVPQDSVHKALAILNGGNALASTLAAPMGSFLGSIVGWRGAFFCLVPLALIVFVWQRTSLPSLPAKGATRSAAAALILLKHQQVSLGMVAVGLLFMGQFMLFTYLRPFLEVAAKVSANVLSITLLGFGVSGFVGTWIIGKLLRARLYSLLIFIPAIMAIIAIALTIYGASRSMTVLLLLLWGLIGTSAPVAWWAWLSKALPHEAEAGGGLMVAVIQMGIMLGAAGGGVLYDLHGYQSTFICAAGILIAGSLFSLLAWHSTTRAQPALQTA